MKKKHTLLLIGTALAVVFLAFPMPAAAARHYIWISPNCGQVGARVGVYGYGFTPGSEITITWDGEAIGTDPAEVVTDESGYFYAYIVVPNVPYDDYTIRATAGDGLQARYIFSVGYLYVWAGPDCGQAGARVGVSGCGFMPVSDITVTWDSELITTDPEEVVTDESGYFYAYIVVPDVPYGEYTIRGTDGEGHHNDCIFRVGSLYLGAWPDRAQAGARVQVYGCGFTPGSNITITWNGEPITTDPEEVVADESGCLYAYVVVPYVSYGEYTIRGTDGEGHYAENVFTVGPPDIWFYPSEGTAGTLVDISGYSFMPGSNITITWNGEPIITDPEKVVTYESGYFYASIVVPYGTYGEYTIRATDGEGHYAENVFTVAPPDIWFYPSEGPTGTLVNISGHPFTPGSNITITWDGEPIATDPEEVLTDEGGYFYASIVVPYVPYGEYTIRATDGEGLYAEDVFSVSPPGIWFYPSKGPKGTRVNISGHYFIPQSTITITWNGEPIATSLGEVVTDEGGYFYAYVVVPDVPEGDYTIRATDGEGLYAEGVFSVGGGCFIATAAYGTPLAEEIEVLREFRDKYLLINPLGEGFVDFYYKVSPPIANFITEHPTLKPIVRVGLLPAVAMSTIAVRTTPAEKISILGLLGLVLVALAVWAKRWRGRGPEYT